MNRSKTTLMGGLAAIAAAASLAATAQTLPAKPATAALFPGEPRIIVPESSTEQPGPAGERMHTNIRILNVKASPKFDPLTSGLPYETPASMACVYGLVPATSNCNPTIVTANATGGTRSIAIVDAFHYPTAQADLAAYATEFGLPPANLQVVFATGVQPPQDPTGGWELEEALDIEMVHALAPGAKIYLVEAASSSTKDLLAAEDVASVLVSADGGGEVSNSWGGPETPGEKRFDKHFVHAGVVYFASSGDAPGTGYPAVSPNVVAVGGASFGRVPYQGDFEYLATWDQGGGGISPVEPQPAYQAGVANLSGVATRAIPDIAMLANPGTGAFVYDTTPHHKQSGWFVVGGTSVGSPSAAALVNNAGHFASSSAAELAAIYAGLSDATKFQTVTFGTCGPNEGYLPYTGWNPCTGIGVPQGLGGL